MYTDIPDGTIESVQFAYSTIRTASENFHVSIRGEAGEVCRTIWGRPSESLRTSKRALVFTRSADPQELLVYALSMETKS